RLWASGVTGPNSAPSRLFARGVSLPTERRGMARDRSSRKTKKQCSPRPECRRESGKQASDGRPEVGGPLSPARYRATIGVLACSENGTKRTVFSVDTICREE